MRRGQCLQPYSDDKYKDEDKKNVLMYTCFKYRVNWYSLKWPFAHETHCPLEDKDKVLKRSNKSYIFKKVARIKDIKDHPDHDHHLNYHLNLHLNHTGPSELEAPTTSTTANEYKEKEDFNLADLILTLSRVLLLSPFITI